MWESVKIVSSIVGPVIIVWATLSYIHAIKHGVVRPHRISWMIWLIATIVGAWATKEAGAGFWGALVPATYVFIEAWVTKLAWGGYGWKDAKGNWAKSWEKFLAPFALLGAAGWYFLVHWHLLSLEWGVGIAIAGDIAAAVFTLSKETEDPASEPWKPWAWSCVGAALGVVALPAYHFSEAGFPVYLVVMTGGMSLWILWAQKRMRTNKARV